MSPPHAHTHGFGHPAPGRTPANHAIVLMACAGGLATLVIVTLVAVATGDTGRWLALAPIGAALFAFVGRRAWRLVGLHGYFHGGSVSEDGADDEDEDSNPDGGSGVRYPPDAPDGGGSLEFDWDAFLSSFWEHVEATGTEPALH